MCSSHLVFDTSSGALSSCEQSNSPSEDVKHYLNEDAKNIQMLQSRVADLESKMTALENQKSDLESKVNHLESNTDDFESKLNSLANKTYELERRIRR